MFGRSKKNIDPVALSDSSDKEWRLIEQVVMANTIELKKSRRWGIFFKLLTFLYLFGIFIFFAINNIGKYELGATGGHTAVINVSGVISAGETASADSIIGSLRDAVKHPDTKAIILRINSPGGSPVQSAYVYNEILRLRELHKNIPFHSVIVDSGASGAYYIASASENIYANGASIVGSIGVTAVGFGFQDLIEKVGIERRQFTSGEHKAFLDPFVDVSPKEKELFEELLNDVHEQFIRDVKFGRGDRLTNDSTLFSGLFWTGQQALKLGLIDELKSTSELARELGYPKIVDFSYYPSPFEKFARNLGMGIAQNLVKMGMNQSLSIR